MRKVFLQTDTERDHEAVELEVLMGITEEEIHYLWDIQAQPDAGPQLGKEPVDQVFRIQAWIMREVGRRQREGGLKVPAPVLSRLYQVLSDGHQAFMQAKKVAYTPFPLPYAQLVFAFLIALMFSSPIIIVAYVDHAIAAATLSFFSLFASFALNEVGRELEDPFGHDPNDLPLSHLHYEFNVRLVGLLHMGMRSNSVNHLNPAYLEEGPVRQRFKSTFTGSVTEKSEIKRGRMPTEEQQGTFQGGMERSLSGGSMALNEMMTRPTGIPENQQYQIRESADAIELALSSGSYQESEDIGLSPRNHASSSVGISGVEMTHLS